MSGLTTLLLNMRYARKWSLLKHQKVSDGDMPVKQQSSVALAYNAARALHVCGFKNNNPSGLNHNENVLDSINIKSRGDEALFIFIFYLRDHIFVLCSKKNLFSSFTFWVCLFRPNRSQITHA